MNSVESFSKGEKAVKIGFITVALIGIVKGIIGWTSVSLSLLAQAIDSLTDLFGLIAIFFGMRLSRRKPSMRFPYGYYRAETLASLIVSGFILLTGGEVLRKSVIHVLHPTRIKSPFNAILIAAASIPVLYLLYHYERGIGEEINSQSIQSQAEDFKSDVYTSSLVLIGVAVSYIGYLWIEGLIGIVFSLYILKAGLIQGWRALLMLMDAVVQPERIERVKELAENVRGVKNVHKVRIRHSGPFCFGVLTITVNKRISVEQAHRLTEEIEKRVKQEYPFMESLAIHMEPQKEVALRIAIPILEDKGMNSQTTPHLGEAPYFLFVDVEKDQIQKWTTKQNPGRKLQKKKGITMANLLVEEEATTLLTNRIGEGPFHYLRDSFVEIYERPEETSASKALEAFLAGKLNIINEAKK